MCVCVCVCVCKYARNGQLSNKIQQTFFTFFKTFVRIRFDATCPCGNSVTLTFILPKDVHYLKEGLRLTATSS